MSEQFDRLVQLMARLRAPGGCPWDRKQTHESLKPYLVEEAYEVLETIDRKDAASLREELGDLLLQVVFHAQIGSEAGSFTIDQILETLADKLIRRHPHVFGDPQAGPGATTAEEVLHRWEEIKRAERSKTEQAQPSSTLDGVPQTLPALLRAYQMQARASRVGFDWPHTADGLEQVIEKIEEEIGELTEAFQAKEDGLARDRVEAEFGDLLFALVNLSRLLKVNPEEALRKATNRFAERFRYIEAQAARSGRPLEKMTLAEMDVLWEEAKQKEAHSSAGPEQTA